MAGIESCGPNPSAADFADFYIDGNGARVQSPLNATQNAAYLAARAAYQQCIAPFQQTPQCPLGEYFAGSLVDGIWLGHCVSDYTGQPTTPDQSIAAAAVTYTQVAPSVTIPPATTPIAPPIAQPATKPPAAPATTPAAKIPATTPATTPAKLSPHDDLFPGGYSSYCDFYPDDPYCELGGDLGNFGGLLGGVAGVTNTVVVQQSGLVAADVHAIVDNALGSLWNLIVGTFDVVLGGIVAGIQNAVTALGNALKAVWNILSRLSGLILHFLGNMWSKVIAGLLRALQDITGWLKDLYDNILKPMLKMLQQIRAKILELWKRFVVPLLIIIQDIRRVLAILSLFHLKFAQKLDLQLASLEAKITKPLLFVLSYINAVSNWVNLIVTAGYLLQKPIFLNSLKAYAGESINLQLNAMGGPLNASTLAAAQQGASVPSVQQTQADMSQFLQTRTGTFAPPIGDAVNTFKQFIGQSF